MDGKEKELQSKIMNYRILESRLESLVRQRDIILQKLGELNSTIESLDEVESSKEILFSLGAEAYTVGKITNKKSVLVDIGAGVLLEKGVEEGKKTLSGRMDELEKAVNEIQNEIKNTSFTMEQLNFQIQNAYQNSS